VPDHAATLAWDDEHIENDCIETAPWTPADAVRRSVQAP
jgi:hypothetical protein